MFGKLRMIDLTVSLEHNAVSEPMLRGFTMCVMRRKDSSRCSVSSA